MFLFGLSKIVGKICCVVLVHFSRYLIEPETNMKVGLFSNFGEELNQVLLFKNNSEIGLYSRLNTPSNSGQVFDHSSIPVYTSIIGFYNS